MFAMLTLLMSNILALPGHGKQVVQNSPALQALFDLFIPQRNLAKPHF
jgi:hypothetical protein